MNRSEALATSPEFYKRYIEQVPDGDVLELLETQLAGMHVFFLGWPEDQWDYRYAEGKWSVKQVLGHITDAERIFGYRILRIARKDSTELPGYDENDFVAAANFDSRTGMDLLEEFDLCRRANQVLLRSLDAGAMARLGNANGFLTSVGAVAWSLVGHAEHHVRVLGERYRK